MKEMVERVAKAIAAKDAGEAWGDLRDSDQVYYEILARAAIEAMREPTEAMITAGDRGMTSELLIRGDCKGPWMNMITEALK